MSLGKLLATGRSLIGGAPGEGRYNISNANRLPKFGSGENPFAPSATSEARVVGSGTGILPVQWEEQSQAESSTQAEPPVSRECSADRLEACPTTLRSDSHTMDERIAEFVKHSEGVCHEAGDISEVQVERTPLSGGLGSDVEQASKPAVSQVSKPARAGDFLDVAGGCRPAGLETGDTAGLETCATAKAVVARWMKIFWRVARAGAVAGWAAVRRLEWRASVQLCRSMAGAAWMFIRRIGPLARVAWDKLKFISIKLAGLFRRREQPEPKPLFPRFGKSVVQAELSLDSIKVVRNNLEDSDLEIVTSETRTGTQVAPTTPVALPRRGPVPAALKKMTGVIAKS